MTARLAAVCDGVTLSKMAAATTPPAPNMSAVRRATKTPNLAVDAVTRRAYAATPGYIRHRLQPNGQARGSYGYGAPTTLR